MKLLKLLILLTFLTNCGEDTDELKLVEPFNLSYSTDKASVIFNQVFESVAPILEGSAPFAYSIDNRSSSNSAITIHEQTGVISINANSNLEAGTYILDVKVSNKIGFKIFSNAYSIKIEAHKIQVNDGFYISKKGIDPIEDNVLKSESVEDSGFSSQDRSGFLANYIFLETGNYFIVEINNELITNSYGGEMSIENNIESSCGDKEYYLIDTELNGNTFDITSSALYKVTYDQQTNEIILYNIEDIGLIGSSFEYGWASDVLLPLKNSITKDGATWELNNITQLHGEFKLRLNCWWSIDRRIIVDNGDYSESNGYIIFTNFGGEPDNLLNGNDGSNMQISTKGGTSPDEGIYTATVNWTPANGFELALTRTGDYTPPPFNPENYQWGIIGNALPSNNWESDIDLNYEGLTNTTHSWKGTYDLMSSGEFKFRANNEWNILFNYSNAIDNVSRPLTLTGDTSEIIDSFGNFKVSISANYTITISTEDNGNSWKLDFQKN